VASGGLTPRVPAALLLGLACNIPMTHHALCCQHGDTRHQCRRTLTNSLRLSAKGLVAGKAA
jgi:hypothetical protein